MSSIQGKTCACDWEFCNDESLDGLKIIHLDTIPRRLKVFSNNLSKDLKDWGELGFIVNGNAGKLTTLWSFVIVSTGINHLF